MARPSDPLSSAELEERWQAFELPLAQAEEGQDREDDDDQTDDVDNVVHEMSPTCGQALVRRGGEEPTGGTILLGEWRPPRYYHSLRLNRLGLHGSPRLISSEKENLEVSAAPG